MKYFDTHSTRLRRRATFVLAAATAAAGLGIASGPPALAANKAVTVMIDDKNCKDGNTTGEDTGDFGTFICGKIVGGWQTIVQYSDARDSIDLKRNGKVTELNLWGHYSGFSSLGDSIEYRMKGTTAVGIVAAYTVQDAATEKNTRYMLAIRLRPTACLVAAVLPGPGQLAQARAKADASPALACKKL